MATRQTTYFTYSSCFLFLPPRRFQWRVLPLTGCTTSFPVWRRCWCLTTIGAFKTLSEGTSGRVVFLPVALQAFRCKLNAPFPTSAESLSGYVNRVRKETASSKAPVRVSRFHLLCSGFPGAPELPRLSWFCEFDLTAYSRMSTGRENPIPGNYDQSAKGQS